MAKHIVCWFLLVWALPSQAIDADQIAPNVPLTKLMDSTTGEVSGVKSGIKEYRGKVVYLDFWASWCGPCRQSFPFLEELRNKYADQGFEVVAVNVDKHLADAQQFLDNYPVSYPILLNPTGTMASAYNVQGLPTAFIIDPNGVVVYRHLGFKEADKAWIIALVEENLASAQVNKSVAK